MSSGDHSEDEVMRVAKNLATTTHSEEQPTTSANPNSRLTLKAKRRVIVPDPQALIDYAVSKRHKVSIHHEGPGPLPRNLEVHSYPLPSSSSSSSDAKKRSKTTEKNPGFPFQLVGGKTIRESMLLHLRQFSNVSGRKVSESLCSHLPLTVDHLRLGLRKITLQENIPTTLVMIALELHDVFYSYDPKTSVSVLGFPVAVWNKIFRYIDIEDLKSFRTTCTEANSLVESSLPWAVNVCFVHDEKDHPRSLNQNPEIPIEMTCIDDSLGWPDVRIRNFKSPFRGEKYFSIEKLLSGTTKFLNIRVLEICDSALHWADLLEAITCIPELEDFTYTHSKEYLHNNYSNVLKIMKGELQHHSQISKVIGKKQRKFKKLQSSNKNTKSSKKGSGLHTVKLQCLSLEITNFVLAVLEYFCRDLKELELIFLEDLFLKSNTSSPLRTTANNLSSLSLSSESSLSTTLPCLNAGKLIHNNQESLTSLRISFIDEKQHHRVGPWFVQRKEDEDSVQIPVSPILIGAFKPRHEKLKLKELILEFPPQVDVQNLKKTFSTKIIYEMANAESDDELLAFCSSQISKLDYFNLKTLHDDNCRIECDLLRVALRTPNPTPPKIFDKDKIVIGKAMTWEKELKPSQWDRMIKMHQKNVVYELNMYLDDASLPYENIFKQDMPVMENCYLLQIIIQKKINPPQHFHVTHLLLKFPNLKRLALVNNHVHAPKITDFDMQAIIYFLPNLTELVLQCDMSEVTDFGLAGIKIEASERMIKQGQYTDLEENDKLGHAISKMKYLQILELHGLGNKVTGVTAYLAFEACALEELYLFSPKFSKRQRRDLKDRFAMKKNFKMMIG